MGSSPSRLSLGTADVVERAIRRVGGSLRDNPHDTRVENAAALIVYLFESGVNDEEELVELAMLADGKRYNPVAGMFD